MKNLIQITIPFLLFVFAIQINALAQRNNEKFDKIREARKEYIGKRLNLTADQEKTFWGVYDAYSEEKEQLHRERKKLRLESFSLTASDQELLAAADKMVSLAQQDVDIEKKYLAKFKTLLNPRQLLEMYKSDRDFNKILLSKLKDRE